MLQTHEDVLEIAKQIRVKQRGDKVTAIARLIEAYEILARHKKEGVKYYTIVEDVRCAKCGGVILKQVHPLGMITPGGSPIIGCPKCKTFSYKHDRSEFVKLEEGEMNKTEEEITKMFKNFELIQNEVIYSDGGGELRGLEQPNNVIVLFAGEPETENVEDYPQFIQFPKAAIPLLIAFLGRVEVPCSEARRLFSIAQKAPVEEHGRRSADYLEHITKCNECIATFKLTDKDIQRITKDVNGYRRGADEMDTYRKKEEEEEK